MLTYIVRRILFSVPVLIVSTFLSFTFVSLAGNPTLPSNYYRMTMDVQSPAGVSPMMCTS